MPFMRLYELIYYPVYASACLRLSAEIPFILLNVSRYRHYIYKWHFPVAEQRHDF